MNNDLMEYCIKKSIEIQEKQSDNILKLVNSDCINKEMLNEIKDLIVNLRAEIKELNLSMNKEHKEFKNDILTIGKEIAKILALLSVIAASISLAYNQL